MVINSKGQILAFDVESETMIGIINDSLRDGVGVCTSGVCDIAWQPNGNKITGIDKKGVLTLWE